MTDYSIRLLCICYRRMTSLLHLFPKRPSTLVNFIFDIFIKPTHAL